MNDLRISSAAVSDRGLSQKRPENQDSYLEMPQRGIFAVADGVGGAQAGEVASQMAVEIIGEAFANQLEGSDAEEILQAAIKRANSAIYQMANELPQLSTMATTIVALHLDGNIATIGHVGDSRAYRVDADGELHRETDDHSMVAEEVRAGRMTEEQAENHPSKNIISRALGAEATVEVDLKTIMIEPNTAFLICSDGITRHVADNEIKGVLTFGGSPEDICDYLKNLCYERGAEDNLTAVVVKVGAAAAQAAAPSIVPPIETEETTIATARSPFETTAADDDPLELDTSELTMPAAASSIHEDETIEPAAPADDQPTEAFSIFEEEVVPAAEPKKSGAAGKVVLALGMLIVGAAIGLATYRFVLQPEIEPQPIALQPRSEHIPLSSYEENRRNVDRDPSGWITKFALSPEDAEDHYLLGRAYMLTGEYVRARELFSEARRRLGEVDASNAKVLATDIATAMAATSGTTSQMVFRKELADSDAAAAAGGNTNSPR